jgi:hypothetical protein
VGGRDSPWAGRGVRRRGWGGGGLLEAGGAWSRSRSGRPLRASVKCEVFLATEEREMRVKALAFGGWREGKWKVGVLADHSCHCRVITVMEVDSHLGAQVQIDCTPLSVTGRSQENQCDSSSGSIFESGSARVDHGIKFLVIRCVHVIFLCS